MTYKEYDNVELYESMLTGCLGLNNLVRNCGSIWTDDWSRNIHDEKVTPHASLTGTATLMTANVGNVSYNRLLPSAVVRAGDYIYMQTQDLACAQAKRLDIMEYQISTGTSKIIQVHSNTTTYIITNIHIAYLMGRKILVNYDCHHAYLGVAPNRYYPYHVFTVDFETDTVTQELELYGSYEHAAGSSPHYDPYCETIEQVISIEDDNEDIWGYVIGMTYQDVDMGGAYPYVFGGCFVYYKNFTQDTAWQWKTLGHGIVPSYPSGEECWVASEPVIIGNEKFAVMYYCYPYGYSTYPPNCTGNMFFMFDINTQELTRSTFSKDAGITYSRSTELFPVYDKKSKLIYYASYSPNDEEYYAVNAYDIDTDTWY
jgi:hypothetical protein